MKSSSTNEIFSDCSLMTVQRSRYWKSWQASKIYNLTLNIYSCSYELDPSCSIRANQLETYVVACLGRDKNGTRKRTSAKKSTTPSWEESIIFSGLDANDQLCIELKMPKWGASENPILATLSFSLSDIMRDNIISTERQPFALTPCTQGISGEIELGFIFDPPILGYISPIDIATSSGHIGDDAKFQKQVFLSTNNAFSSFLFYPDASTAR